MIPTVDNNIPESSQLTGGYANGGEYPVGKCQLFNRRTVREEIADLRRFKNGAERSCVLWARVHAGKDS